MESLLDQVSFVNYRIKTFEKSPFEKSRGKCTAKKLAEAGFYFAPTTSEPDTVKCYACNIEVFGWNQNTDDPWTEHSKENPNCMYLNKKKSYTNHLTMDEFLKIEESRFLNAANLLHEKKKKQITELLDKLENSKEDEILISINENNSIVIDKKQT